MQPDERPHRHLRRALQEHPWALHPAYLDIVVEVVERRVSGGARLSEQEVQDRVEAAKRPRTVATAPGSIAVLPLFGVVAQRMDLFMEMSGGTSTEAFADAYRQALSDPSVSGIVLNVDSPGGSVFGVEELADTIYSGRGQKPVVAVANSWAASAAYWIASQADELWVTPSGEVGSIGVLAVHEDVSKAAEQQGFHVTYITAGKYKAEANPFEPLKEEARAYLQERVNDYYDAFVRAVARGRGATLTKVREEFGEGRMLGARQAVGRGMADREGTLQQAIDRMLERQAKGRARAEDEAPELLAEAEEAESDANLDLARTRARARVRLAEVARRA